MTRLLVTRPALQASELVEALAAFGIDAVSVPAVATTEAGAAAGLAAALRSLQGTRWLVITSVNGAHALLGRLAAEPIVLPADLRIAAVGPATARALEEGGLHVDHVPAAYRTVAIADGLGDVAGHRVLLARADAATPDLADALRARGARVDAVVAYRTLEGPEASRPLLARAMARGLDGITFTSGSTVRGLVRLASEASLEQLRRLPAHCIGPVTADVARTAGFAVAVVATEHTATGLASAIAGHLSRIPEEIA